MRYTIWASAASKQLELTIVKNSGIAEFISAHGGPELGVGIMFSVASLLAWAK